MSAIIRLRPNRIVLTPDEVRNLHPRDTSASSQGSTPSPAAILAWNHNITRRRARARASRKYCAETLDLYAPELEEEVSDGSVKILEDEDEREVWSGSGGGGDRGKGDGREGVVSEGSTESLILPFADVGVRGVQVEAQVEEGRVQHAGSDGGDASASASGSGGSSPTSSPLGAGEVDDAPQEFIDIAYLADVDFDPPDSPLSSPPTIETYLDGAAAALASLDISTAATTTTTGTKTPTSLLRFAERESSSPGDGISGLSPRHKAVEKKRLAKYRDRSLSREGARLRRSRIASGGFDGDDERSDSGTERISQDHDDDSTSSTDGGDDKRGTEDVDASTQTDRVEELEGKAYTTKTSRYR
ncbi:hypothetical protein B9Z19DRAFT_1071626 [Tuber borchii]|uniref:Uncharacterized protein n=1 Tax=Tuber borchii TaxID=42251 RepID=A0A2T7A7Q8_TUBBO|nr:hypothetical protein B9Z19DRAFT_1071626 [Tuber borchii]